MIRVKIKGVDIFNPQTGKVTSSGAVYLTLRASFRVITWDNFFLGGDTNCPVNAQIRLYANGDFATRSNEVETVCRRVNSDDWDDDESCNATTRSMV